MRTKYLSQSLSNYLKAAQIHQEEYEKSKNMFDQQMRQTALEKAREVHEKMKKENLPQHKDYPVDLSVLDPDKEKGEEEVPDTPNTTISRKDQNIVFIKPRHTFALTVPAIFEISQLGIDSRKTV